MVERFFGLLAEHALRRRGLLETVSALYKLAEVPKPPKAIHCLRHTFGTVMARRVPLGVPQELMGYSDIVTTMRHVEVSEDDKRDAIAAVFGALGHQAGNEAADARVTELGSADEF